MKNLLSFLLFLSVIFTFGCERNNTVETINPTKTNCSGGCPSSIRYTCISCPTTPSVSVILEGSSEYFDGSLNEGQWYNFCGPFTTEEGSLWISADVTNGNPITHQISVEIRANYSKVNGYTYSKNYSFQDSDGHFDIYDICFFNCKVLEKASELLPQSPTQ